MRGIAEIREANRNPGAYRATEEHHGVHPRSRRDTATEGNNGLSVGEHAERVEAPHRHFSLHDILEGLDLSSGLRQPQRHDGDLDGLLASLGLSAPPRRPAVSALDKLLITALALDFIDEVKKEKAAKPGDALTPKDDIVTKGETGGFPPSQFTTFWERLNATLKASGKDEALYAHAREAFTGGPTPIGAITFIGKDWEGIRAVPAAPVTYLGGARPAYHGEVRVSNPDGSASWHKVVNSAELPISYQIPEAALTAARDTRNEQKEHG